jgi:hypothetical protein
VQQAVRILSYVTMDIGAQVGMKAVVSIPKNTTNQDSHRGRRFGTIAGPRPPQCKKGYTSVGKWDVVVFVMNANTHRADEQVDQIRRAVVGWKVTTPDSVQRLGIIPSVVIRCLNLLHSVFGRELASLAFIGPASRVAPGCVFLFGILRNIEMASYLVGEYNLY